jgi:hypothetical protein
LKSIPHEADVNAEAAMHGRAVYAEEDPVSHRRPSRVLCIAIETNLNSRTHKTETKTQNPQSHYMHPRSDSDPPKTNQKKKKKKQNKTQTLFSDFAFSFLNKAFLSENASDAMAESLRERERERETREVHEITNLTPAERRGGEKYM